MPSPGPVVSNSGPLIVLSRVNHLDLLANLYGSIVVPNAVFAEVVEAGAGRPGAAEVAGRSWVVRSGVVPPPDPLLSHELGAGEAEAITLAKSVGAGLLLVDEVKARRLAVLVYGLRVKGTAGVLVEAKRRGFLERVKPIIEEMQAHRVFLSRKVIERTLKEAGEL